MNIFPYSKDNRNYFFIYRSNTVIFYARNELKLEIYIYINYLQHNFSD